MGADSSTNLYTDALNRTAIKSLSFSRRSRLTKAVRETTARQHFNAFHCICLDETLWQTPMARRGFVSDLHRYRSLHRSA